VAWGSDTGGSPRKGETRRERRWIESKTVRITSQSKGRLLCASEDRRGEDAKEETDSATPEPWRPGKRHGLQKRDHARSPSPLGSPRNLSFSDRVNEKLGENSSLVDNVKWRLFNNIRVAKGQRRKREAT